MKNQLFGRASAILLFGIGLLAAPSRAQTPPSGMPDLSDFAGAIAQKVEAAPPQKAAPTPKGGFASGLAVPRVKPGEAARGVGHDFRLKMEEADGGKPETAQMKQALAALEDAMPAILTGLEGEFSKRGLAPRDMGTAYAFAFLQLREDATGKTTTDTQDRVVGRTLSSAIGRVWAPKWAKIAPDAREVMYEKIITVTALNNVLIEQFKAAGKSDEEAAIRRASGDLFKTLVGVSPQEVNIASDGRISGLKPDAK